MNTRIFTDEQKEFLIKNLEENRRLDSLLNKVEPISDNAEGYEPIEGIISYLNDSKQRIARNLEPFIKRNNIYKRKLSVILEKNGYGPEDMLFDSDTLSEIIFLQHNMLEEVSNMSCDLRSKKISDKEKDTIFQERAFNNCKILKRDKDFDR